MSLKNHTVIEITDQCVKALQTKAGRGRTQLLNQIVHPLENQTEPGIEVALAKLAKHKMVGAGAVFLILPRQLAILKLMRLPSVDKSELRKMVEIQISSQTPYTLEEVEYDFHVIESGTDGYTQVILFVIPREVTTRYIEMMNRANIPFSGLTISTQGMESWYRYQCEHKQLDSAAYVALCNVDQQQTEIAFFKGPNLLFSRSSNQGLADIRRGQTEELVRQIELSLNFYRNEQMGLPIEKVIVILNVPDFQGFCGELEHHIQIPCHLVSSLEGMTIHNNVTQPTAEEASGVSLTAALGVSISEPKNLINLLPKVIRDTKTGKIVKRELIKLMVLGIVIYGLAIFLWSLKVQTRENQVQKLQRAVATLDPQIDSAKQKMKLIEFFDERLRRSIFVPEIMSRLAAIVPDDISFSGLHLNEKRVFTIQGYAQTREALNDFQANLVNESMFRKCNLDYATSRKIFNIQVTDFKFTCLMADGEED